MLRFISTLVCAFFLICGGVALVPQTQAASSSTLRVLQQPAPTAAPVATATASGRRERVEAPPLRPQAAALLIGVNLALAAGVVLLAWYLRRRQRRPR